MKIEDAKRLYAIGGESKDIALIYFSEDQLKERTLPKKFDDLDDSFSWTVAPIPIRVEDAFKALGQLYLLKQEYNGDWVADWNKVDQERYYVCVDLGNAMACRVYFLTFKSESLRDQFAANFADLIEAAKPLLG